MPCIVCNAIGGDIPTYHLGVIAFVVDNLQLLMRRLIDRRKAHDAGKARNSLQITTVNPYIARITDQRIKRAVGNERRESG